MTVQNPGTAAKAAKKPRAVEHQPGPLARAARIRSDVARHAYMRVRRLLSEPLHHRRRKQARTLRTGAFALDRDSGFLILPPGAIAAADAVVGDAQRALDRFLARPEDVAIGRKTFLINVLKHEEITVGSSYLDLALHPDVLAAVSVYLGLVPLLTSIQVFYSDVMTKAPQSSQLFHCDGDDVEQVKLFLLCSEVEASGGPLTILPAAASAGVRRATKYQYRQRLKDKEVKGAGGGKATEMVGPAGTAALVDTSRCFHFGSRVSADARPRLLAMIQYQTPYSFMLPVNANRVAPFRQLATADMPLLERMVLGAA